MNIKISKMLSIALFFASTQLFAAAYTTPALNNAIIGQIQYDRTGYGETAGAITLRYDIGYNALKKANPHIQFSKNLSSGIPITLPTRHLLPNLPREGIIINLPEMRMYYFPAGSNLVYTYPIGIGKVGKTIPITQASITRKTINPTWTPPDDIREFNLKQGVVLPQVMPAGPDNPLGPYAIYMSVPTYLIHSTIFPESIGKRASFGCIRMYETDIKSFFPSVASGIPVAIINYPSKVGWQENHLYLEAHQPLEEHGSEYDATLPGALHMIASSAKNQAVLIDWQAVSYIMQERDGVPHDIGIRISK